VQVTDRAIFRPGVIYVPHSNHHLLVNRTEVAAVFGPRENRSRPSIDTLFRSAAAYNGTRVIAILLTGYLNDGVNGLAAVKQCGGVAMVQSPQEADAPDLPENAIRQVDVDQVLTLEQVAAEIRRIAGAPVDQPVVNVPEEIMEEVKFSEHQVPDLDRMDALGDRTPYTCPECGGTLWNVKGRDPAGHYVCHTGHSFTIESFLSGQAEVIENSLWAAVRYLQERANVLKKLSTDARTRGKESTTADFEQRMDEMKKHALIIRRFIMSGIFSAADTPKPAATG